MATSTLRRAVQRPLYTLSRSTPLRTTRGQTRSFFTLSQPNLLSIRDKLHPTSLTTSIRHYANVPEKTFPVPPFGMDSVVEGTIGSWKKQPGEQVNVDDVIVALETDKIEVEVRSPDAGVLVKQLAAPGDVLRVGADLFVLAVGAQSDKQALAKSESPKPTPAQSTPPKTSAPTPTPTPAPASAPAPAPAPAPTPAPAAAPAPKEKAAAPLPEVKVATGTREDTRIKMTQIRKRIAQRLKESQNTAAMLTTFNEIDMHNLINLRNKYKDQFQKKHGVKLGFMSAFVRASSIALSAYPEVNNTIDDDHIIQRNYHDISVAVASPAGLVVPVIRNAENLSFSDIEKTIAALAEKAQARKLAIEEMTGGTFTISNGGVYGSMMGTPILNPPQSAILGMHATNQRPFVVDGEIKIRPIMYVALTYDHRLIDGREAVLFLKKIKSCIEEPESMLLDL